MKNKPEWLAMARSMILGKYTSLPVQVKGSLWFLICSFLQKGISMITTPIFTRIMATSDYGQFGVFNSWLGIVTIFVSLNLSVGVHLQGIVKFSEERSKFTSSLLGLTTVLITAWTIIYLIFHDFWNRLFSLTTVQMFSMMLIIFSTAIFNFWANEQKVIYSYRILVFTTLLVSLCKPALEIILVIHSDDKVTARILGYIIVDLIAYTWMYFFQMWRGGVFYSKKFWKYALTFNLPLVPHYLSQTVLNSADRIMIQNIVGDSEAGIYNLAYSVSLIMTMFNAALMQTISPWMYQKIKDKRGKEIASVAYLSLVVISVANLLLILLAPEVVSIFAPEEYYEAIYVIPPVAMSVFFMYAYDLFAKFAFYYEKTAFIMIASVSGAALNILLNSVFIHHFGYIAAGYTTLICFMIYTIIHYIFMRKVCRECCGGNYPYKTRIILLITILFLMAGFAFLFTYKLPVIRYGIVIITIIFATIFRHRIIRVIKDLFKLKKVD